MAGHRLKDGIICDSSEGKCRVWTAGTELRSDIVSKMLYMRVTEPQQERDCTPLTHVERVSSTFLTDMKPSHV